MKTSVLLVTCIFITVKGFSGENQNLAIEKCVKKTGISESTVSRMGVTLEIPDSSIAKKFLMCLNKKMGFQDEEGQMLFDNIRDNLIGLSGAEVNSTISTCKQIKGSNSIENSYLATKCIFRKIKSIIKLKKRK